MKYSDNCRKKINQKKRYKLLEDIEIRRVAEENLTEYVNFEERSEHSEGELSRGRASWAEGPAGTEVVM